MELQDSFEKDVFRWTYLVAISLLALKIVIQIFVTKFALFLPNKRDLNSSINTVPLFLLRLVLDAIYVTICWLFMQHDPKYSPQTKINNGECVHCNKIKHNLKNKTGFEKAITRLSAKPGEYWDKLFIVLPLAIIEMMIYQLVIKSAMYRNIW
jgi:hypothetical protein